MDLDLDTLSQKHCDSGLTNTHMVQLDNGRKGIHSERYRKDLLTLKHLNVYLYISDRLYVVGSNKTTSPGSIMGIYKADKCLT